MEFHPVNPGFNKLCHPYWSLTASGKNLSTCTRMSYAVHRQVRSLHNDRAHNIKCLHNFLKQAVQEAATICPAPCKLTFDLLTLKVVSESHVTRAISLPILVFLGLSVLDLGPIIRCTLQTDVRQTSDSIIA